MGRYFFILTFKGNILFSTPFLSKGVSPPIGSVFYSDYSFYFYPD